MKHYYVESDEPLGGRAVFKVVDDKRGYARAFTLRDLAERAVALRTCSVIDGTLLTTIDLSPAQQDEFCAAFDSLGSRAEELMRKWNGRNAYDPNAK